MIGLREAAAGSGLPVYFYGSDQTSMAGLVEALQRRLPALRVAGAEIPPMLPRQPEFDMATAERIRRSGARLVFVGLGCPKQEFWMQAHRAHLDAVMVGV